MFLWQFHTEFTVSYETVLMRNMCIFRAIQHKKVVAHGKRTCQTLNEQENRVLKAVQVLRGSGALFSEIYFPKANAFSHPNLGSELLF